jgi:hypothetical protein
MREIVTDTETTGLGLRAAPQAAAVFAPRASAGTKALVTFPLRGSIGSRMQHA